MTMLLERESGDEDKDPLRPVPNFLLAVAIQELELVVPVAELVIIHLRPISTPVAERQRAYIKASTVARLATARNPVPPTFSANRLGEDLDGFIDLVAMAGDRLLVDHELLKHLR
jgi:hypothetical protein